jgi:hypothetical protein
MVIAYEGWLSGTAARDVNELPVTSAVELDVESGWGARPIDDASPTANQVESTTAAAVRGDRRMGTTDRRSDQPVLGEQRFRPLARWRGRVSAVEGETFWAALEEMDRPDVRRRDVKMFRSDVGEADLDLLREGAVFYWSIGYLDTLGGQRTRQSTIKFQRRPGWTEEDQRAARQWAADMKKLVERV